MYTNTPVSAQPSPCCDPLLVIEGNNGLFSGC